jgi:hypothetical protein
VALAVLNRQAETEVIVMEYKREAALERIRQFLANCRKEEETTCQTVARLGIFCKGFDIWSTEKLREQYPWLTQKLPKDATREELLKLIIAWDGARAEVLHAQTTCDARAVDHDGCLGFDRWNNENLKRLFPQLFGPEDKIV